MCKARCAVIVNPGRVKTSTSFTIRLRPIYKVYCSSFVFGTTHCTLTFSPFCVILLRAKAREYAPTPTATHHNKLQHTTTHNNTLHHPALPYNLRQHPLQHNARHCTTLQHTALPCNTLQSAPTTAATHCNTLQHTATHCDTRQHPLEVHNTASEKYTRYTVVC